ncbi:MAG: glycosyltransferase family 39 protein [Dehalococcoidia bacterium]
MPWLALGVLVAAATALRFWNAGVWPYGLEYDEGLAGTDVLGILAGSPQIYFREAYREPLYVYLMVPFVALMGREALALRLPMMLLGVATVPLVFLLVRDLFGSLGGRRAVLVALVAAGLCGLSFWPLVMSRSAIPGAALPPFATLTIWMFWRAWAAPPPARGRYLAAGLTLGVTLYCYLPARLLPLVIVLFLAGQAALNPSEAIVRRAWRPMMLAVAASGLVWLPLGLYYLADPPGFFGRASHVSIFRPGVPEGSAVLALLRTGREAIGAFLWQGDSNWYHNLPGRPIFDLPVAVLAVAGLAALIWRLRRPESLLVLIWAAVMLLPGVLSDDNNPNTARLVSMIPVAFIFPAVGLDALIHIASRPLPRLRPFGEAAVVLLLLAVAVSTARDFAYWAEQPEAYAARSGEAFDAVAAMNARAAEPGAFFLLPISNAWPESRAYQHRSIQFLYRGPAPYAFLRIDDEQSPAALAALCNGCRQIYTVAWEKGPHVDADPKGLTTFLLNRAGLDVLGEERRGFDLLGFEMPEHPAFVDPPLSPLGARLGGRLEATAASIKSTWTGRDLALVVDWLLLAPSGRDEKLSYRAIDEGGRLVGQVDRPLLANDHLGTSRWEVGAEAIDRAIVPLQPGTPPGRLRVEVVAYEGGAPTSATLGTVDLGPARVPYRPDDLDLDARSEFESGGVQLVGYLIEDDGAPTGGSVLVTLIWRITTAGATPPSTDVVLLGPVANGGDRTGSAGSFALRPFPTELPPGQLVADPRRVSIALGGQSGAFRVEVRVGNRAVAGGGTVTIAER